MELLGNVLWFIFGGLFSGLSWILSGVLWCITIVGIPYGRQCFQVRITIICSIRKRN